MAVYVDMMNAPYGRMKMCHMIADSTEELNAMADKIGVARKWIQKAGHPHEHYDICQAKRQLAVANGAIVINRKDLATILNKRWEAALDNKRQIQRGKPLPITTTHNTKRSSRI